MDAYTVLFVYQTHTVVRIVIADRNETRMHAAEEVYAAHRTCTCASLCLYLHLYPVISTTITSSTSSEHVCALIRAVLILLHAGYCS